MSFSNSNLENKNMYQIILKKKYILFFQMKDLIFFLFKQVISGYIMKNITNFFFLEQMSIPKLLILTVIRNSKYTEKSSKNAYRLV